MGEKVTVGQLRTVLHEPPSTSVLLARILRTFGEERCVALLAEALTLEHQGGLWRKDGSCKRTLGGLFLGLCREQATASEKRQIFR